MGDECTIEGVTTLASMLRTLGELPPAADDGEHIDRIRALEELKGAVAAAQARETAEFAAERRARRTPAGPGAKARDIDHDIAGQVALARRISPYQARRYVGFAAILTTELPETFRVLAAGQTSEWRAILVARNTAFLSREHRAEVDRLMAHELPLLSDKRVDARTREHAYRLDPRGSVDRASNAEKDRRVTMRPAPDTMVWLSALLPVAQGVACYAALTKAADSGRAGGDPRGRGQLMADTLVERLLGQAGTEVGVEIELVMTDRTLFGADADDGANDATGSASQDSSPQPAWLSGYGPLPARYARELALGPTNTAPRWLRRLYTKPNSSELVAMDSRRRLFTPAQRRFARLRDQFCRTPWCDAPIRHIDHVVPSEAGGSTDLANAQGLCEACNHTKQAPGWRAARAPDGEIEVVTPTGHRYASRPPLPSVERDLARLAFVMQRFRRAA